MPWTMPSLAGCAIFAARLSGLTWYGNSVTPQGVTVVDFFNRYLCALHDGSAARAVNLLDAGLAEDRCTRRKSGP